ncbi:MAG: hypothetical protein NXI10_07675 [bacterium]|nr:hypothetical protein [bacterium]
MTEEKTITESSDGSVLLTNHKIRYTSNEKGHDRLTSIMLNEIATIEIVYVDNRIYLIIGIILCLGIFTLNVIGLACALFGGGLLAYYFLSKKHVISIISSASRSIDFETKGLKTKQIMRFVDQIESAKQLYEIELFSKI